MHRNNRLLSNKKMVSCISLCLFLSLILFFGSDLQYNEDYLSGEYKLSDDSPSIDFTDNNVDYISLPNPSRNYGTIMEYSFAAPTWGGITTGIGNAQRIGNREWDLVSLVGGNFIGGELVIEWTATFATGNSYAEWQYSVNGGTWTTFDEAYAYNDENQMTETLSFDLRQLSLQGNENNVDVRVEYELYRDGGPGGPNSDIGATDLSLELFYTTMSDNSDTSGNINNLGSDLDISITVNPYNAYADLSTSASDYKIYYNFDGSAIDQTSANISTSDTISASAGDPFTLTYSLPVSQNETIHYCVGIKHDTYNFYYFGDIKTVEMYDGIAPTLDDLIINSGNDEYYFNEELLIEADLSDTGGMGLLRAALYWKVGDAADVSKHDYEGEPILDAEITGNSDKASFPLPLEALDPLQNTSIIIYVYDGSYNEFVSQIFYLDPLDDTAPEITFIYPFNTSSHKDNTIEYDQSKFQFHVNITTNEPRKTIESDSGRIYWKTGDAPTDSGEFGGVLTFTITGSPHTIENYIPSSGINIQNLFALNDTVHFWINVTDVGGNENSTFENLQTFTIVDTKAPNIEELIPISNINYTDDFVFRLNFNEPLGAAGVDNESIHVYYRINDDIWDINEVIELVGEDQEISDHSVNYTFIIEKSEFSYGDMIYLWANFSDTRSNKKEAHSIGFIEIVDMIKPLISLINDYPATNISFLRTYYDALITISTQDFPDGSGLKNVSMAYRNTNDFLWNEGMWDTGDSINFINATNQLSERYDQNIVQFLIPESEVIGGQRYYIKIRAYDFDGNFIDYKLEQDAVSQHDRPTIEGYSLGNSINEYLNYQSFTFTFSLSDDSLMYVYLNGELQNSVPYAGNTLQHDFFNLAEGSHNIRVHYFNYTEGFYRSFEIDVTPPNAISKDVITITRSGNTVELSWQPPEGDEDSTLTYYIYRGNTLDFNVDTGYQLGQTTSTSFSFNPTGTGIFYYKIVVQDRAGNRGDASESIELEIKETNLTPIFIVVGIVGGVGVMVVVIKKKGKNDSFLKGDELAETESDKTKSASKSSSWDDTFEDDKDIKWEDLSTPSYTETIASKPKEPVKAPKVVEMKVNRTLSDEDVLGRFTAEMREMYNDANDFLDMDQESMAIQSFEMLLRKAENIGDQNMVSFIKKKMDEIY